MSKRTVRMLSLGVAATAGLAAAYGFAMERTQVHLDEFTVRLNKPGLPPGGLTILHLSDLHCREKSAIQERKLNRMRQQLEGKAYDLLLVTGDLIHDEPGFPIALDVISSLKPRLGAFTCPGNHDYCESSLWGVLSHDEKAQLQSQRSIFSKGLVVGRNLVRFAWNVLHNERVHKPLIYHNVPRMNAELERHGIHALVNRSWHLEGGALDLWLAGIDDSWEGQPDVDAAVADVPLGAPLVFLMHNPDAWLHPQACRADLILSGHVHGGQVRLPILGAVHTQGTHLSRSQAAGWFCSGSTRMFVTRGLGESLQVRFGAPPQIALIRLIPAS